MRQRGRAAMMGALLGSVGALAYGMPVGPAPRALHVRKGPKYPGQRGAYLVGAWRPMSRFEINDHNAAVEARKAAARERALLERLGRTVDEISAGEGVAYTTAEVRS